MEHERVETRAVEGELRPGRIPGVPLAGRSATSFRHFGRAGEVVVHGLLRRGQLARWDHARYGAPPVGVPTFLQLGRQRGHDGRITSGPANIVCSGVRPAGPFEKSDRVGHFPRSESCHFFLFRPWRPRGVLRPPFPPGHHRTAHDPGRDDSPRPGGPGHLRQGAHRIGQDAGLRPSPRRQHGSIPPAAPEGAGPRADT